MFHRAGAAARAWELLGKILDQKERTEEERPAKPPLIDISTFSR